jgi:ABC-type Fe3+ transport system substrate-binding protein
MRTPTNGLAAAATALDKLVAQAVAEGATLTMEAQTFATPNAWKAWEQSMEQTYGHKFTLQQVPGPSMPEVAGRIVQEVAAGQQGSTDIYIGNATHFAALKTGNALVSVPWMDIAPDVDPNAVSADGTGLLYNSRLKPVLYYNTNLVPNKAEVPTTLAELANPRWKGKFATTVYASTWDRITLIWGAEYMNQYMPGIVSNVSGLLRCGDTGQLASGKFALFFACGDTASLEVLKAQGAPVDYVWFKDILFMDPQYVGVPKNSPHSAMAELFAVFLQTPGAQQIYEKDKFECSAFVKGTSCYDTYQKALTSQVKPTVFDLTYILEVGDKLDAYIQHYSTAFKEGKWTPLP